MKKLLALLWGTIALYGNWEGESYAKNLSSEKKGGFGIVSRIELEHSGVILDVGCGDGGITAQLAQKFPESRVVGVDFSPSMINYATQAHQISNLFFNLQDARLLQGEEEYDLIVSIATMHWIKEQPAVLSSMHKALKPEGKLLIQMPLQLPALFYEALENMFSDSKWSSYFEGYVPPWTFYHLGEYLFFLYDAGFILSDMQVFPSKEVYPSQEVFRDNLRGWLPFLEVIPENLREDFLLQLIDNYLFLNPIGGNGEVYFEEPILEIKCIKLKY